MQPLTTARMHALVSYTNGHLLLVPFFGDNLFSTISTMAMRSLNGKLIQRGGFGEVWAMKVDITDVARKYFKIEHQYDNELFWNKAIVAKGSNDRRIEFVIKMLNCGRDILPNELYIDMELAEKALFDVAIGEDKQYTGCPELSSSEKIEELICNLFNGLEFLHSSVGMLHNDIKPENILLKKDGKYAFCDFGFATPIKGAMKKCGTPQFTAPEHYDDSRPTVDDTSDVFSLGITLLTVFDYYDGIQLPMVTCTDDERKVVGEQTDEKVKEAMKQRIRRKCYVDYFKNHFYTPNAIGKNVKFTSFKWQYSMIIAGMVNLSDRPGSAQLLPNFRDLMQRGGNEQWHDAVCDPPPEGKLHEPVACEHLYMDLSAQDAAIPPIVAQQAKVVMISKQKERKAKRGGVRPNWYVPQGHEHIIKLAEKMQEHGLGTMYNNKELDVSTLSADEKNMRFKLMHESGSTLSVYEAFLLGLVCLNDGFKANCGYIFKSLTKRTDNWWKESSKKTLKGLCVGMDVFHKHYLNNTSYRSKGFAASLKRKSIALGDDVGTAKVCKLNEKQQKIIDMPLLPTPTPAAVKSIALGGDVGTEKQQKITDVPLLPTPTPAAVKSIALGDDVGTAKVCKSNEKQQKIIDMPLLPTPPPPPPAVAARSSSSSSMQILSVASDAHRLPVYRPVEVIILRKKTFNSKVVYKEHIGKQILTPADTISIVGDGNCFLRALSVALTNDQGLHSELRKMMVEELNKNFSSYEKYMDPKHKAQPQYIVDAKKSGTWATAAEIYATATRLGIGIYVYIEDPSLVKVPQWIPTAPIGKSIDQVNCVYLQLNHKHYTCVSKFHVKS